MLTGLKGVKTSTAIFSAPVWRFSADSGAQQPAKQPARQVCCSCMLAHVQICWDVGAWRCLQRACPYKPSPELQGLQSTGCLSSMQSATYSPSVLVLHLVPTSHAATSPW